MKRKKARGHSTDPDDAGTQILFAPGQQPLRRGQQEPETKTKTLGPAQRRKGRTSVGTTYLTPPPERSSTELVRGSRVALAERVLERLYDDLDEGKKLRNALLGGLAGLGLAGAGVGAYKAATKAPSISRADTYEGQRKAPLQATSDALRGIKVPPAKRKEMSDKELMNALKGYWNRNKSPKDK